MLVTKLTAGVVLTLGLAGGLTWWGDVPRAAVGAADDTGRDARPEVTVRRPQVLEIAPYEDFVGRIDAVMSVDLRSRVRGMVQKVFVTEGAAVRKGELLFQIDPAVYEARVAQADGEVAAARARLKLAEATLTRLRAMKANNQVSREDVDRAEADLAQGQANLDRAEAVRKLAALEREYTQIRSPIDGKVGPPLIAPGSLAGEDTRLLTIHSVDPICVFFDVDERTAQRLSKAERAGAAPGGKGGGFPVQVGVTAEEGFPHRGKVDAVSLPVNPATGTVTLRGTLANADESLRPGMFARVRLTVGGPTRSLLVPEFAVGTDQGRKFVDVVTDKGVVERRTVKLGSAFHGLRVIEAGVTENDWVVTGADAVRPGTAVRVRKDEGPADRRP
jgi:RND family efflux transporter MFP subunit